MQQMAWREALDDARGAGDVDALAAEVSAARHALLAALVKHLDEERDFDAAVADVRALMFVERFADELDEAADRLSA